MKTKHSIRNYMEFIREASQTRGYFGREDLRKRHHLAAAAGQAMGRLGWINYEPGKGSKWTYPRPQNEVELLGMAKQLHGTQRDLQRQTHAKAKASHAIHRNEATQKTKAIDHNRKPKPHAGATFEPIAKAVEQHEQRQASAKKKEQRKVSILWGLVSWTR